MINNDDDILKYELEDYGDHVMVFYGCFVFYFVDVLFCFELVTMNIPEILCIRVYSMT